MKYLYVVAISFISSTATAQSWIETGSLFDWSGRQRSEAVVLTQSSLKPSAIETIMDAAYLSKLTYGQQSYQQTTLDRGWIPIASSYDVLPGNKTNSAFNSGFSSALFKKGDKYILSFRGSEDLKDPSKWNDWVNNALQIMNGPKGSEQYRLAESTINHIINKYPYITKENLVITGHSLGGGLAQYAANLIPGMRAVTFNAAGLKASEISRGANPYIANINDPNDPVSQNGKVVPRQTVVAVSALTGGIIGAVRASETATDITIGGVQGGQEYLLASRTQNNPSAIGNLKFHFMDLMIDNLKVKLPQSQILNSVVVAAIPRNQTTSTITSSVSATGPISFPTANITIATVKRPNTVVQSSILSGGNNSYQESAWSLVQGVPSNLQQNYPAAPLQIGGGGGEPYTLVSNTGSNLTIAEKTFRAGTGNNGTFNFQAMVAYITQEANRVPANSIYRADDLTITFTAADGRNRTLTRQQIFDRNNIGGINFPNATTYGARTTNLTQLVQSLNQAPGSVMSVRINVPNSTNNDTRFPSTLAIRNVQAR